MTENDHNGADKRGLDSLHLVRSLSAEMSAALSALAENDLERFEASVAAQERLCDAVRSIIPLLRQDSPPGDQPATLAPVAAAGRELRQQNRVYVAALTRAAQVCAALLSLYQDSPRGYSPDGRTLPVPPTWSCEV